MANHDLHVSLLVGNTIPFSAVPGGVDGSPENAVLTIAPAFEFQRDDETVGWRVPVPYQTTAPEFTIPGLAELDKDGNKVTWELRVQFIARRNADAGSKTVLFQIPDGAPSVMNYPDDIQLVDVVQPPEYGPTYAQQARADAEAAEASRIAAVAAAAAAIAAAASIDTSTLVTFSLSGDPADPDVTLYGNGVEL
jgi:hypothetical protein